MKNVIKKVVSLLIASVMVFGMLPLTELTELDFTWVSELFETKAEAASTSFLEPYKIVLRWGASPRDLDSHLEGTLSNGSNFHCYFSNKKIYDGSTLIADLDVDDTSGYGPETITISPSGLTGSYTYYIYNYTGTGSFSGAGATAELYYGDKLVETVSVPSGSGSGRYWSLFKFEDGKVRLINTVGTSVSTSSGELINTPIINEVYNEIQRITECAFSVKVVDGDGDPVRGAEVSVYLGKDRIGVKDSDSDGMVYFEMEDLNTKKDLDYLKKKATVSAHLSVGNGMELCSETVTSNGVWEGTLLKEIIDNGEELKCDEPRWIVSLSVGYTASDEKEKKKRYNKTKSVCESFAQKFSEMTNGHVLVSDVDITSHPSDVSLSENTYDVYVFDDPSNIGLSVKTASTWSGIINECDYGGNYNGFIVFDYGNLYFTANILCHEAGHLFFGLLDEYCYGRGYYADTNNDGEVCGWDCSCQDTTGDDIVDHEDRKNSGDWDQTYSRPKLNGVSAPGNFGVMDSAYFGNIELSNDSSYKYLYGVSYDENHPEWYTRHYYIHQEPTEKTMGRFLENRVVGYTVDYTYSDGSKQKASYSYSKISIPDYGPSNSAEVDLIYSTLENIEIKKSNIDELSFLVTDQMLEVSHSSSDIANVFLETDNSIIEMPFSSGTTELDVPEDYARLIFIHNIEGKEYKEVINIINNGCLVYASIDYDYVNGEFSSVEDVIYVIENTSQAYCFEQALTVETNVNFQETFWFYIDENGECCQLETLTHYGENSELFYSTEITNVGRYVLMSKNAVELTEASISNFTVSNDPDGDGIINISFVDSSAQALCYELYYSTTPINDINIEDESVSIITFKGTEVSVHIEPATYYFVLKTKLTDGSFSCCYDLSSFEYTLNDLNNDGIPDSWIEEYYSIKDLENIADTDSDDDGLTNLQEYQNGTNPINPDTDGDNVYDSVELWHELNPLEPMTDGVTDDYIVVYGIPDVAIDSDSFVVDGTTVTCTITNNTEGKAMRTHIYLYAANGDILELSTVNMNSNSSVDYTFSRDHLEEGMRIVLDEEHITRDSDYSNNEFVYVPATNIIASNPEITLVKGLTAQLEYALTPEGASRIVEWESADENIVSVNKRGLISAVRIGKTTITVTTISGYTGTYAILVEPFPGAGETDFDCQLINNNTELEIIGYYGSDENIAIPDFIGGYPVTSIADVAFEGCTFKSVIIGEGVGSISLTAFEKVSTLKKIEVAEGNPSYKTNSGVLYNADMTQLLHYPRAKDDADFSVPETVTTMGNNAFANTSSLNAVNIPETVVTINSKAFSASSVTTVNYAGSGIAWSKVSKASDSGVANLSISYGKYTATFVAEGEAISQTDYKPGETIVKPENPTLKYYDFAGWSPEVPETMPESDSEFTAMWTLSATTRLVEYYVDGELYWYDYRNAGEEIIIPDSVPTKVGHTFANWSPDIADVMPDENLMFEAVWNANVHQVTFTADEDTHYTYECAYGETLIVPEESPTKEGYTFTGWSAIPDSMPDADVEITAIFEPIVYTATFTSGGETIGTDEFTIEDSVLNYPSIEAREHYAWVWDDHRIVADNIIVNGEYIPVTYTATFAADGEIVETVEFNIENQNVVAPDIPHKKGYTYAWEEYEIQLADFTVNAVYTPIVYTATFTCGEEILGTDEFTVEDKYLNYPKTPTREYYSWKWENHKIEANNLTINGGLVPIEYTVKFVAMGETVNSQTVTVENCEIVIPDVPERPGYASEWERTDYYIVLKNCTINAVYKPITYTATFTSEGKVIGTDKFTVEDDTLLYPAVLPKSHYQWVWNEHRIEPKDIIIEGGFVPVVYTVKFVSNGRIRKTQNFTIETVDTVSAPSLSLPNKAHYTLGWETYEGRLCNMTINEVYTPIKYKLSFYCQNNLVSTNWYTIENTIDQVIIPDVPNVPGYEVVWPSFKFTYKEAEVRVEAVLTPIEYTAQFVADGNVISTQTFTVESEGLVEPYIPQKAGYIASWSYYTISAGDKVITAKYRLPEVMMQARRTLAIHETYRLLPMANFTADEKVWTSSDTSVATVDQNGKVTALTDGECIITATFYGKDSLGNDIQATATTKIIVEDEKSGAPKTFRELFDEFFEVTLHEILFNFREFLIMLFKYAH